MGYLQTYSVAQGSYMCLVIYWDIILCGCSGLWPFWFLAFQSVVVSVCGHFGLWPFRSAVVSVCCRSGLWPFGLWPFQFFVVSVCLRFGCGHLGLWPLWPVTVSEMSSKLCKIISTNQWIVDEHVFRFIANELSYHTEIAYLHIYICTYIFDAMGCNKNNILISRHHNYCHICTQMQWRRSKPFEYSNQWSVHSISIYVCNTKYLQIFDFNINLFKLWWVATNTADTETDFRNEICIWWENITLVGCEFNFQKNECTNIWITVTIINMKHIYSWHAATLLVIEVSKYVMLINMGNRGSKSIHVGKMYPMPQCVNWFHCDVPKSHTVALMSGFAAVDDCTWDRRNRTKPHIYNSQHSV